MSICKEVAVSAQCSFILTMAEMLFLLFNASLAIQKAVKGKLLNVEVAVLAILAGLLLVYVHLLLADTTVRFKTACRCVLENLNFSMWMRVFVCFLNSSRRF